MGCLTTLAHVVGVSAAVSPELSVRGCKAGEGCEYVLTARFTDASVDAAEPWSGIGSVDPGTVVADASGGADWVANDAVSFRVSLEDAVSLVHLDKGETTVRGAVTSASRYANAPTPTCAMAIDSYGLPCCWEGPDAVYHMMSNTGPAYTMFTVADSGSAAVFNVTASVDTAVHGNETASGSVELPEIVGAALASAANVSASGASGAMGVFLEAMAASGSAHATGTLDGYVLARDASSTLFVPSRFFETPATGPATAKLGVTSEEWLAYFKSESHGPSVCDPSVDQSTFLQLANGTLGDQWAAFKADPLFELPSGCVPLSGDGTCVDPDACAAHGYAQAMTCGIGLASINVTITLTDARVSFARVTPEPIPASTMAPTMGPTPSAADEVNPSPTPGRPEPSPLVSLTDSDGDPAKADKMIMVESSLTIRGGLTVAMFTDKALGLARAFEVHFRNVMSADTLNITCVCEGNCDVLGGVDLDGATCRGSSSLRYLLKTANETNLVEVHFVARFADAERAEHGRDELTKDSHYDDYALTVEEITGVTVEVERGIEVKKQSEDELEEMAIKGGTLALLIVLGTAMCVTFLACVMGKYAGLERSILGTRPRGSSFWGRPSSDEREEGDEGKDGPEAAWRPKRKSSDPLGLADVHVDFEGVCPASFISIDLSAPDGPVPPSPPTTRKGRGQR